MKSKATKTKKRQGKTERKTTQGHATPEKTPEVANQIRTLVDWLGKRTYTEKLTAVAMYELLRTQSVYSEKDIANEIWRGFEDAVCQASSDLQYLKTARPIEIVVTAFTAALIPMDV